MGAIGTPPRATSAGTWYTESTLDGGHTISARGTAGDGTTSPVAIVNVTVRNVENSPPSVTDVDDREVEVGEEVLIQIEAIDANGDDLVFRDDTDLFDINATTGLITFNPSQTQVGTWRVAVTVYDGSALVKVSFTITVRPRDDDGGFLESIPLTPIQGLLLLMVVISITGALAHRSRKRAGRSVESGSRGNQR